MAQETVRAIMKRRDGLDDSEVDDCFEDFAIMVAAGDDPEEALAEVFGLEPDYLLDSEVWGVVECALAGPRPAP